MQLLTGILFLTISIISIADEIYVEVNEEGVKSYSDYATLGSRKIQINKTITYSDPAAHIDSQKAKNAGHSVNSPQRLYYSAKITDPTNYSEVRSNSGSLRLKVSIEPPLRDGHKAQLIQDGMIIRNIDGTDEIHLDNLDRGTHNFNIQIRNHQNEILSDGITTKITILRHSIQH